MEIIIHLPPSLAGEISSPLSAVVSSLVMIRTSSMNEMKENGECRAKCKMKADAHSFEKVLFVRCRYNQFFC